MKKLQLSIIIILVLITFITMCFLIIFSPVSKNDKAIEITIPLGTNSSKIADILKENKIIRSKLAFRAYVKIYDISNFQAGTYYLKQNMRLETIIGMLQTGKMNDPNQINITYIEGKNIKWLADKIQEVTNNKAEDVYTLLANKEYINSLKEKYWFITDEVDKNGIYYSLEGYLFPDTYTLKNKDVKIEEIFKTMLDQMEIVLEKYKTDIENSEYNAHQILTMASIIEMESMSDEGRKDVSSVIYNRLKNDMAIQSDVTTYYAFKIEVGERDLYKSEINKYNEYNTRRTKHGRQTTNTDQYVQ